MEAIKKCTPAYVYVVIAVILLFVMLFVSVARGTFSLGQFLVQACGIFFCTVILVGLCAVTESTTVSWVIVTLLGLSTLSGSIAMMTRPKK